MRVICHFTNMKSHFDPIISAWLAYEISQSREFPTWGFQCVHSMSQPKHPAPSSSIHRLVSSSLSILAYLSCSPSHSVVEKSSKEDSTTVWLGFLDFLYEEQYVPQVDASPVLLPAEGFCRFSVISSSPQVWPTGPRLPSQPVFGMMLDGVNVRIW